MAARVQRKRDRGDLSRQGRREVARGIHERKDADRGMYVVGRSRRRPFTWPAAPVVLATRPLPRPPLSSEPESWLQGRHSVSEISVARAKANEVGLTRRDRRGW